MRRVGHEHAITTRKAQIGRQCCALVAALFLDHLNQQDLTAANDILNLVTTAQIHALCAKRVDRLFIDAIATGSRCGGRCVVVVMLTFDIGIEGLIIVTVVLVMPVDGVEIVLNRTQTLFLSSMLGFFAKQRLAVFLGDLIVIGMYLAEREEAVAVAAIIDERGLQRRFDPRYLRQINVALKLLVIGRFEIEFFYPVTLDDRDPGFFPVARIDQHTHGH